MGDHTEAISIDYNPKVISYTDLLTHFWNAHQCGRTNTRRQYMNAVFYRNEDQRVLAEKSRAERAKRLTVTTEVLPVNTFTYAEAYHQKYYLTRYADVRDFLTQTYPDGKSLADSTVATRLNAYLGSATQSDWAQFLEELPSYGLPESIHKELKKSAEKRVSKN